MRQLFSRQLLPSSIPVFQNQIAALGLLGKSIPDRSFARTARDAATGQGARVRSSRAASTARAKAPVRNATPNADASTAASELERVRSEVARHNDLYTNSQPEITDAEYDSLKCRLRELEAQAAGVAPEEIALPVGAPPAPASGLRKVAHLLPMLSLAAANSREETESWLARTLARLPAAQTAPAKSAGPGPASVSGSVRGSGSDSEAAASDAEEVGNADSKRSRRAGSGKAAKQPSGAVAKVAAAAVTAAVEAAAPSTSTAAPYKWVVEPKVDGLAVRVLYRREADGTYRISEAATRGDGLVGEDVTHNAMAGGIAGLPVGFKPGKPLGSATKPAWVEVRGEVFMRLSDLEELNREQKVAGQSPFANTRNAAAGGLRLLDPVECRRRRLSFVAYAAMAPAGTHAAPPASSECGAAAGAGSAPAAVAVGPMFGSQWSTLRWLEETGFAVSPDNRSCSSAAEALKEAEQWMARRSQLGYDADGVVIKLDDTTLYDTLGVSGSDPRWAVAWKFPASEALTQLEGIELTVGRQGQITPVALLRAVVIGGVTIRRASLHNVGYVEALGLHEGDWVALRRCGDVIPKVVRVHAELRPPGATPWQPPSTCPCCGGDVSLVSAAKASAGDQLICDNPACGARSSKRLAHFASVCFKDAGASGKTVEQLAAAGLVTDLPDFYSMDQGALAKLIGPARAQKLVDSVAASRSMSAASLLQGLNIPKVGQQVAAALGKAFPRVADLVDASAEQIKAAAGLGDVVSRTVADWFEEPGNQVLLAALEGVGVQCIQGPPAPLAPPPQEKQKQKPAESSEAAGAVEAAAGAPASGPAGDVSGLQGMRICITGTIMDPDGTKISRNEMQELLRSAGAEVHDRVKTDTQLLLAGAGTGATKTRDAAKRGVQVMQVEEFWKTYGNITANRAASH